MRYADWKAVYIDKTKTLEDWRKAKDAEYAAQRDEIVKRESKNLRGLAAGNKLDISLEGTPPKLQGKLPNLSPEMIDKTLKYYEEKIVTATVENAIIITAIGDVYHCTGGVNSLDYIALLGDKLNGAFVTHNHPVNSSNEYSFSASDRILFTDFKLAKLRGIDEKYVYEFNRNADDVDEKVLLDNVSDFLETLVAHAKNVDYAKEKGIGYRRWRR